MAPFTSFALLRDSIKKKHHRDGGIRKAWKAKTKRKGGQRSGKAVPRNVAMSLAKSTASTFR